MKYCENCGKEIQEGAKFCNGCGSPIEAVEPQVVSENENAEVEVVSQEAETAEAISGDASQVDTTNEATAPVKTKKKIKMTKTSWIIVAAVAVAIIIAVISIVNVIKINKYKSTIEDAYSSMSYGAEKAESYCSLQSKVWRNCIMESSSVETDEYTQDEYGRFYDDFNDALSEFYEGESTEYSLISINVSAVNSYMSKLKDCPEKLEDEYTALKQMYVAYSELTDLVVGNSSYSSNSFSEALETAKSNYKTAKSAASLIIE